MKPSLIVAAIGGLGFLRKKYKLPQH